MERCKTCKHWDRVKDGEYGALPGTGACKAARQIWDVTESKPPDYDELQLLPEHTGLLFMLADGSHYMAKLITMLDFGCVMHEHRNPGESAGEAQQMIRAIKEELPEVIEPDSDEARDRVWEKWRRERRAPCTLMRFCRRTWSRGGKRLTWRRWEGDDGATNMREVRIDRSDEDNLPHIWWT